MPPAIERLSTYPAESRLEAEVDPVATAPSGDIRGIDQWLRLAILLAIFASLNATMWSVVVPPGFGPDEGAHVKLAQFFAAHGRPPEFGVDEGMGVEAAPTGDGGRVAYISYAGQPQLPYAIAGLLIRLPTDSEWMDFHQARAAGAIWIALTTLFAFLLARRVTSSPPLAAGVAAMVSLWPHLVFLNAYVNQEAYTIAASTGLMWSWWRGYQEQWRMSDAVISGVFVGLVAQGKINGYVLLALTLVVVATTLQGSLRHVASRVAAASGVALAVCAWWLLNAVRMYGSDIFAFDRASRLVERLDVGRGAFRVQSDLSLWGMLTDTTWVYLTVSSFLGRVGPVAGLLVAAVVMFGAVGALLALSSHAREIHRWGKREVMIALTMLPVLLMPMLSIRQSWAIDYQPQGRYLFVAFVPFILLVVIGLAELGTTRRRSMGLVLFGALVVAFANIVGFFNIVLPLFNISLGSWIANWRVVVLVAWSLTGLACVAWFLHVSTRRDRSAGA